MPINFRKAHQEEPEINLIPFIDVLLVVIIFLMLSTTYSKFTELQITLPTADADKQHERPSEVVVLVSSDGRYLVNKRPVDGRKVEVLSRELAAAANSVGGKDAVVIISADAAAPHQSVITVMDAARRANLPRMTFAAQNNTP
jgi:biopolymer transport protein ExbD